MPEAATRKGGRPPRHKGERLSKTRTFRVRGGLDEYLKAEAAAAGRSVSEEIEMQLELARIRRDHLIEKWGGDVFDIADRAARALWHIENFTGEEWVEDDRTYDLFQRALSEIVRNYRDLTIRDRRAERSPEEGTEGKSDHELAQMFAALSGVTPPGLRPIQRAARDAKKEAEPPAGGAVNLMDKLREQATKEKSSAAGKQEIQRRTGAGDQS